MVRDVLLHQALLRRLSGWASMLELRDDIDFAAEVDGLFRAIYLLATSELEGPLDEARHPIVGRPAEGAALQRK